MKKPVKNTAIFANHKKPYLRQHSKTLIGDIIDPIGAPEATSMER